MQRIIRHSDPRVTERYTHLDPAYLHGEMDALMRFEVAKPRPVSGARGSRRQRRIRLGFRVGSDSVCYPVATRGLEGRSRGSLWPRCIARKSAT